MSLDFFSRKQVSGRKPHQCAHCRQEIGRGEMHFYCVCKFDGYFSDYREHTECEAAWVALQELRETRWDDAHPLLADDDEIDDDEREWLHEKFPAVARRIWPNKFGVLS